MPNLEVKVAMVLVGIALLFGSGEHHRKVLAVESAYKVNVCPRNKEEWQNASRRLNCSDDDTQPKYRYHCLPDGDLTTLVEFCYNRTRPQVVKGLCMVYLESNNYVNHYNCSNFKEGCPNTAYYSNEIYKFPACIEIDPNQHCYKAELSCHLSTRLSTVALDSTTLTTLTTSYSAQSTETNKETNNSLAVALPVTVVCILLICILGVVVWMKRRKRGCFRRQEGIPNDEGTGLLNKENMEKIEADINRSGIDYLLQQLPNDQKIFPTIAKLLKIPQEIVYWSQKDRGKFVSSMKAGNISVYSGRGMVIGCAEAGKTTLVKKLKGEKNLNTGSTSGIEIHPHVFKLDANESTITACLEQEKNKGCLCLTPTTLDQSEENEGETSFSVKEEVISNKLNVTTPQLTQNTDTSYDLSSFSAQVPLPSISNINENSTREIVDDEEIFSQSNTPVKNLTLPIDVSQEDEERHIKAEEKVDFRDCTASVNTKNLKMLSLLDFAGHSAYYACHHIFFSPRAFFILVVDMTKDLESVATEACREQDLIYSNWTYADYVRYWLGSIHTYSSMTAPVILVASHAEANGADPKKALEYYFKICRCLPEELKKHVDKTRVFSVEKDSNKNMERLKNCIASTVKSQSHWGEKVPIAWTKLESVLKRLQGCSKIYLLSNLLNDVQKTKDSSINNEEELINALTFFHETGVILFRSEIKNIIILDVQWFVDAFKCIILDEKHMEIKDKSNLREFDNLNRYGLLSSELLNKLWKNGNYYQHKKSLVYHMKQLDMLAELSEEMWYVPCMNKQKYSREILANCSVSSTLCFLFEFLPFVIFHRLVVACINTLGMKPWESATKMCMYHTVTILSCEDPTHRVLIGICENRDVTHFPYSIEIQTNVTNPRKPDLQLSSKLKKSIIQILIDLTQAFPSRERSFKVGYRCKVEPFSGNPESHIIKEEETSASEVDCSKCPQVHIVDVRSILRFWENTAGPKHPDVREKENEWILLSSLQKCNPVSIPNVFNVNHISHATSKELWLSNRKRVIKSDHSGNVLNEIRIDDIWGSASHTVDDKGNILVIREEKVFRCTSNGNEEVLLTPEWTILSIFSSKLNGDLLLGIYILIEKGSRTRLARYTRDGRMLSEIEYFEDKRLYVSPMYISENINGDVCTSDIDTCLVRGVDHNGKPRFSYDGLPSHKDFFPTGICNDKLGHVIVCNRHDSNPSVHLLDMNGQFLLVILRTEDGIHDPWGLCVDDDGKLYVGQNDSSQIMVFKYLEKATD